MANVVRVVRHKIDAIHVVVTDCSLKHTSVVVPVSDRCKAHGYVCYLIYCHDDDASAFALCKIKSHGTVLFDGCVLGTRFSASAVTQRQTFFRFDGLKFDPGQPMEVSIKFLHPQRLPVNLFFELAYDIPLI